MKLPGGETAVIPPGKLAGYALNVDHPRGGPKARVFRAALGLGPEHTDVLAAALLHAARTEDAELLSYVVDQGTPYRIDFVLDFNSRSAVIRSGWIVPFDGSPTALTTAFVRRRR